MAEKRPEYARVRLRLTIVLPAIMFLFTLGSALLSINLLISYLSIEPVHTKVIYEQIVPWVIVLALISLISGFLIAVALTGPLQRLKKLVDSIPDLSSAENGKGSLRPSSEAGMTEILFERVLTYIKQLVKTKNIFDVLPKGIIAIGSDGKISLLNLDAAKYLGLNKKEDVEGKHYSEIIPALRTNEPTINLIEGCLGSAGECLLPVETRCIIRTPDRADTQEIHTRINCQTGEGESIGKVLIEIFPIDEVHAYEREIDRLEHIIFLGSVTSGLTHQIKNPLAIISAAAQFIRSGLPEGDSKIRHADSIISETARLDHLTRDLLSIGSISESGKVAAGINEILSNVAGSFSERCMEKKIAVITGYDEEIELTVNREKLIEAFSNIVSNACDVTPENGTITISTSREDGYINVSVMNSGSYIPPEKRKLIFEPFFSTKSTSSGLGMPIARIIINAHGGDIAVDSDEEKGTTFTVTLPVR